ncbi:ribonuclease Z [Marinobacter sp. V034]|uniref:ribonuclease Z n=1 Tax=Marinobacter sp. V034 TaxID=3459610 RepID=UPI004044E3A6
MKFTFLGTSAGTPTTARNVTALALQHGGPKGWYLVDCGEGTQHQLLRTRYSMLQLRAILITHVHGDHTFGLPGLLSSASMAGRTEPLPLIAPAPVRAFVETALAACDSTLSYPIEFIDVEQDSFEWRDDYLQVERVPLSHRVPCYGYVFTERNLERSLLSDKLKADGILAGPVWGKLQQGQDVVLENGTELKSDAYTAVNRQPRRLIVAGDNDTPELLRDACAGAQVLIHEATYTQAVSDRVGPAPQHSSAAQVAAFAESAQLPALVLTHFSARYQYHQGNTLISEIADEARQYYNGHLNLADDFAEFELHKDLTLTRPGRNGQP